jgi:hypothetical protein
MTEPLEPPPSAGLDDEDDDWEPEPTPVGNFFRDLRANPGRFFAFVGTLLFVGGWAITIYIAGWGLSDSVSESTAVRLQFVASLGSTVSIAAAINWGVAWLIWTRRPEPSD